MALGWSRAASLVVARCGNGELLCRVWPWAGVRHGLLWATTWLELAGGLGRVSAVAAMCVEPPRWRMAPRYLAVVAIAGVVVVAVTISAAVVLPVVVLPVAVVLGVLMAGGLRRSWSQRPQWGALSSAAPPGAWRVVNLARVEGPAHRGAGRALLEAVCAEADSQGRVLRLDTTSGALVRLYEGCGFAVVARADFGNVDVARMVRLPKTEALR